jgi:hypothetical protein
MGSFAKLSQWHRAARSRGNDGNPRLNRWTDVAYKRDMMTLHQWLGIALMLCLGGFIVFAFRQGEKVKPSGRNPHDSSAYDFVDHSGRFR